MIILDYDDTHDFVFAAHLEEDTYANEQAFIEKMRPFGKFSEEGLVDIFNSLVEIANDNYFGTYYYTVKGVLDMYEEYDSVWDAIKKFEDYDEEEPTTFLFDIGQDFFEGQNSFLLIN